MKFPISGHQSLKRMLRGKLYGGNLVWKTPTDKDGLRNLVNRTYLAVSCP